MPVTTGFAPVDPSAKPATCVVLDDGPEMFKSTPGVSPVAPPTQCLITVTEPAERVLVNVHTTLSLTPTEKLVGSNDEPVAFLTHDAPVWVQPATKPVSVAEYVPVTTGFAPVVPFPKPVTCVVLGDKPTTFKFTVGASPVAPPTHTLLTVTEPAERVLVIVHTTLSFRANREARQTERRTRGIPHTRPGGLSPTRSQTRLSRRVGAGHNGFAPVDPSAKPATCVVLDDGPEMFKSTPGVSPVAPPTQCLITVTEPAERVLVNVHTTLSLTPTEKLVGSNDEPVAFLTHDAPVWVQPATKPVSVAE